MHGRHAIRQQVDEAVAHGARVECGGRVIDGVGCYYQPTILTGLTPDELGALDEAGLLG